MSWRRTLKCIKQCRLIHLIGINRINLDHAIGLVEFFGQHLDDLSNTTLLIVGAHDYYLAGRPYHRSTCGRNKRWNRGLNRNGMYRAHAIRHWLFRILGHTRNLLDGLRYSYMLFFIRPYGNGSRWKIATEDRLWCNLPQDHRQRRHIP